MTPAQVELVKDGFQTIYQDKQDFARSFFTYLFQIIPAVRESFPEDMTEQHRKLAETLTFVIYHLHDPAKLHEAATMLAGRHLDAKARQPHFVAGAVALERALDKHMPRRPSREETEAWHQAFLLVTDMMAETLGISAA